jgi:hypothetical protein
LSGSCLLLHLYLAAVLETVQTEDDDQFVSGVQAGCYLDEIVVAGCRSVTSRRTAALPLTAGTKT